MPGSADAPRAGGGAGLGGAARVEPWKRESSSGEELQRGVKREGLTRDKDSITVGR